MLYDMVYSEARPPLPPDDVALLSESGSEPHAIRALAESRVQEYQAMIEKMKGYIIQLLTIQNMTAPLHATLPPEVLMHIFRHICPACPQDIRITHVCKLWRDLIHRTPEFWADMLAVPAVTLRLDHQAGVNPTLSLTTFMERSSPVPYRLDIREKLTFLTTVPSHISRIYSLSLYLPVSAPGFMSHLAQLHSLEMPLLESMECRAYETIVDGHRYIIDLNINRANYPLPQRNNFPRLRTLSLYGPGLASRAFTFPSLRKLSIDDGRYSIGLEFLLDVLEGCPQLQTLGMNMQSPAVQSSVLDHEVVFLPHLRTFSLSLHAPSRLWVYKFLEQVRLPEETHIKIVWLAGSDTSSSMLLPASPPAGVAAIQAIQNLEFRYFSKGRGALWVLRANGFVPGDPDARLALHIHYRWWTPGDSSSRAIADLARLFAHARSIKSLKLRLERRVSIKLQDWLVILNALPTLSSLTVHIDSCRNLLSVLCSYPTRWHALVRLSISCRNGTGVHECLLAAVEARAREGMALDYLAFSGDYKKPLSAHRMHRLKSLVREVTTVDELEL